MTKKKKANKRDSILQATLELIAEHGFHGTPAAGIAERAGVGIGTIYRYFASKDELIFAVMNNLEDRVADILLGEGFVAHGPVRERFTHIVRGLLAYNIENQKEFRFIEQFMNSPYGAEYRSDRLFSEPAAGGIGGALHDMYVDGISRGEVKDLPLPVLHALTFGPVNFAIRDHVLGLLYMNEDMMDATVDACWDAVCARR